MKGYPINDPRPENISVPNILENFETTLATILEVESLVGGSEDGWKWKIKNNVSDALYFLQEERQILKEMSDEDKIKFLKRSVTGFMGRGGFNRWIIRGDGRVAILKSHSFGVSVEKAAKLGFEIDEY